MSQRHSQRSHVSHPEHWTCKQNHALLKISLISSRTSMALASPWSAACSWQRQAERKRKRDGGGGLAGQEPFMTLPDNLVMVLSEGNHQVFHRNTWPTCIAVLYSNGFQRIGLWDNPMLQKPYPWVHKSHPEITPPSLFVSLSLLFLWLWTIINVTSLLSHCNTVTK